jgi:hypothetical protein
MSGDVRITMIGYQASGKTSYLLGMYHQMMIGSRGFTMRTVNLDDSRPLELKWDQLAMTTGKERWPEPTAGDPEDYHFILEYGMAPFVDVDWVDYRGGTLDELYQSSQIQDFMARLTQSTCIALAISGEFLAESVAIQAAVDDIRVQRINDLLSKLVRQTRPTPEKPLPIAIVVTKYDYCMAGKHTRDQIEKVIQRLLHPLFAKRYLVLRPPSFLVGICRVTLGEELAEDSNEGTAIPRQAQDPILFAAWASLQQRLNDIKGTEAAAEADEIKAKIAILEDRLKSVSVYKEGVLQTLPGTGEQGEG